MDETNEPLNDDPELDEELPSDDRDEDGDEEADETSAKDEADDTDDGEDGEDPDGSEDPALPKGVRQRLAKVTAKRRAAEQKVSELEAENERLRERSGENDPKVYLSVAERHGILPQLLDAKTAKGLSEMSAAEARAKNLRDLLDDLEDSGETEIELGGKSYTRGALRRQLRATEERAEELRESLGDARKRLRERTAKLLKLGLAAEKAAQAKGKGKAAKPKRTAEARDEDEPSPTRRRGTLGVEARPKPRRSPAERLEHIIDGIIH